MKKIYIYLAGLFFIVYFSSCTPPKMPEVRQITSVEPGKITSDSLEVKVNMNIYNPNKFDISILNYNLDILLNDASLGNTRAANPIILSGNKNNNVTFTLTAGKNEIMKNVLPLMKSLFSNDKVKMTLKGPATFKAKGIRKQFRINHSEKVDVREFLKRAIKN